MFKNRPYKSQAYMATINKTWTIIKMVSTAMYAFAILLVSIWAVIVTKEANKQSKVDKATIEQLEHKLDEQSDLIKTLNSKLDIQTTPPAAPTKNNETRR